MERLTIRCGDGVLIADSIDGKYDACEVIDILAARLAAYEDTGLTPEQIKAMTSTTVLRIDRTLTDAEVEELREMLKQPGTLRVLTAADLNADACASCGAIVPEGRQVCPQCEAEVKP